MLNLQHRAAPWLAKLPRRPQGPCAPLGCWTGTHGTLDNLQRGCSQVQLCVRRRLGWPPSWHPLRRRWQVRFVLGELGRCSHIAVAAECTPRVPIQVHSTPCSLSSVYNVSAGEQGRGRWAKTPCSFRKKGLFACAECTCLPACSLVALRATATSAPVTGFLLLCSVRLCAVDTW